MTSVSFVIVQAAIRKLMMLQKLLQEGKLCVGLRQNAHFMAVSLEGWARFRGLLSKHRYYFIFKSVTMLMCFFEAIHTLSHKNHL